MRVVPQPVFERVPNDIRMQQLIREVDCELLEAVLALRSDQGSVRRKGDGVGPRRRSVLVSWLVQERDLHTWIRIVRTWCELVVRGLHHEHERIAYKSRMSWSR